VRKLLRKLSTPLFLLLLILNITLIRSNLVYPNPLLELNIETDKPKYYNKDVIQIYGNLTLDGTPVTNGLIAIQIQTSENKLLTIRTLSTGEPPPETPYVYLQYVMPCDENGNPKNTFTIGTLAYFKVCISNFDIEPRKALITINLYYNDSTPFGYAAIETTISAQTHPIYIVSIPIPSDAVLGTATTYANAYTDWPQKEGTPYCLEVNATFEISTTNSLEKPLTTTQQTNETNATLTLRLARKIPRGNYTIYATSRYLGETVYNTTTFEVYILGDLGGGVPPTFFAFDGKVDSKDYSLFLQCLKGIAPPEAMYLADLGGGLPPKFFQFDGKVDSKDYSLFLLCLKGVGP
jgi:hypothetical protein